MKKVRRGAPTRAQRIAPCALVGLSTLGGVSATAHAQDPGGSIVGQLHISDGDLGGGAMIDLWGALGPSVCRLRLGGFFGVIAIPSERDWHNRTMMPLGAQASLALDLGGADLVLQVRGGLWGGASQEHKLLVGGLVGGGAYLDVALEGGVAIGGGVEVLGFFGGGDTWSVVPGLRLTWGREIAEEATEGLET